MIPAKQYVLISEVNYFTDENTNERHECVKGQDFAMAGSSLHHSDIALNRAYAGIVFWLVC